MSYPNVAVCVPSMQTVDANFAMHLAGLASHCASLGIPICLLNQRCSVITAARNDLVLRAHEHNADMLLFIDCDLTFPRDALQRLLEHRMVAVGATYPRRAQPFDVLGTFMDEKLERLPQTGLVEMKRMPGGMMLFNMELFRTMIPFPWFQESYGPTKDHCIGEDFFFCDSVRNLGYQIWCDAGLSREVTHASYGEVKFPPVGKMMGNMGFAVDFGTQ